ncbi:hypothetical protein AURDEDRAFT_162083 [Auricularia subglabra TFB-10046 SS5]|nr:hypothetical protein AURDEDRAFT_162083 [Auricularia subglabra TFB-10046 SS5]
MSASTQVKFPTSKKPRKADPSQRSIKDYLTRPTSSKAPESTIPARFLIKKTLVRIHYGLTHKDIAALKFREETTTRLLRDGSRGPVTKHLYSERDIQLAAWDKHGGPKAFKAFIDRREQAHDSPTQKTHSEKKTEPSQAPWYLQYEPWVWAKAAEHLDQREDFDNLHYRQVLKQGLPHTERNTMPIHKGLHYPVRREEPLPQPSSSFEALLSVLAEAGPAGQTPRTQDGATVYWPNSYLARVFDALVEVIDEHGLEGWARARWEVYDKFAECFGSIAYDPQKGHSLRARDMFLAASSHIYTIWNCTDAAQSRSPSQTPVVCMRCRLATGQTT